MRLRSGSPAAGSESGSALRSEKKQKKSRKKGLKVRFLAFVLARLLRKAWKQRPKSEQEVIMKNWNASRAQWARIIGIIASLVAAIGMNDISAAITEVGAQVATGSVTAIIAALLGVVFLVVGFFDRQAKERQHAEVMDVLKGKQPAGGN
jgi:hypothetical protein